MTLTHTEAGHESACIALGHSIDPSIHIGKHSNSTDVRAVGRRSHSCDASSDGQSISPILHACDATVDEDDEMGRSLMSSNSS